MNEFIDFLRERGLEPASVKSITISEWGAEVLAVCSYDPYGSAREFRVLFQDCSQVSWTVYGPEHTLDLEVEVIGFEAQAQRRGIPIAGDNKNVAVLTTTAFELIISYSTMTLHKPW
jgi:hypothetical protein